MKSIIFVGCLVLLGGCTDASFSRITSLGSTGHVVCYSGEKVIYDGSSTGKIMNSSNSDGYYFRDTKSNLLVEVSGNCVITYNN